MSPDRGHLSIGEVLSLLTAEFPDVTISKIRFLESQGLIDPERTPSGYRKFYEPDIVRLRWILTQQRDHFLPLKVIKDRLAQAAIGREGQGGPASGAGGRATAVAELDPTSPPQSTVRGTDAGPRAGATGPGGADTAGTVSGARAGAGGQHEPGTAVGRRPAPMRPARQVDRRSCRWPTASARPRDPPERRGRAGRQTRRRPERRSQRRPQPKLPETPPHAGGPRPADPRDPRSQTRRSTDAEAPAAADSTPPDAGVVAPVPTEPPWVSHARAATQAERATRAEHAERFEGAAAAGPGAGDDDTADRRPGSAAVPSQAGDLSGAHLTPEELLAACDLSAAQLAELERFGLVSCRELASGRFYDDDAVVVARLASRFAQFGIEARHLRMFKVAAEREAALYEQVVSPLAHHRDPARGTRASEVLGQLESLGEAMRAAMVRRAERDTFGNR